MTPMGRVVVRDDELADVRLALNGRTGHFKASKLYAWYVEAMEREGRTPSHPVRFGQMLAEYGAIRRPVWDASLKGAKTPTTSGGKRRGQMVKGWLV